MTQYIFGKHAVFEALSTQYPVQKVFVSKSLKDFNDIIERIRNNFPEIKVNYVNKQKIDFLARGARSGGICALLERIHVYTSIDTLLKLSSNKKPRMFIALDEITDPRNFGAIIRSALGAGFDGVVFQMRRQSPITGIVASSSAGACFRIPLCAVVNVGRALAQLKKKGFWVYGSGIGSFKSIYEASFNTPLVLVIGSEGKGMRRLVSDSCDEIVTIPLPSELGSLNASVASGVIMFEINRNVANRSGN